MKARIERWLQQRWYGGESPGLGLRSLAGLYRLAEATNRPTPIRLPVPVLVVGNFTAGGTGKTPLVIALAQRLAQAGWRPGIVSRGYGRRGREPLRVDIATPVAEAGDEPSLMAERTGLPVFVDADRVAAGREAVRAGCTLVICDDGLQHRRLARDLEIEVLDGERRYGNGLLLPAGPLREPPRSCDFRVINGGVAGEGEWPLSLQLGAAQALDGSGRSRELAQFAGAPVQAVAGIGHPERFFQSLREQGLQVDGHAFPDHHAYSMADFARISRPVLMTEKDAIKCRVLGLGVDAWSVPVDARLPELFYQRVIERVPRS